MSGVPLRLLLRLHLTAAATIGMPPQPQEPVNLVRVARLQASRAGGMLPHPPLWRCQLPLEWHQTSGRVSWIPWKLLRSGDEAGLRRQQPSH